LGSTLFNLTWKPAATPLGRSLFRLAVSGRRTEGLACIGWPTPLAHNIRGRSAMQKQIHGSKHGCSCLVLDAKLASWPTPRASDTTGPQVPDRQGGMALREMAQIAHWATPTTMDGNRGAQPPRPQDTGVPLSQQVAMPDGPARLMANGELLTGSGAEMSDGGQLNPALPRWLMGYRPEWCECADTAMQSYQRKPRRSSQSPKT
ncbi:MAG: hypothetical protein AAGG72_10605, partial [Pseudomonadota bacterium]